MYVLLMQEVKSYGMCVEGCRKGQVKGYWLMELFVKLRVIFHVKCQR